MKIYDVENHKSYIASQIRWMPSRSDSLKVNDLLDSLTQFSVPANEYLSRNSRAFNALLKKIFILPDKGNSLTYTNYFLKVQGFKRCNRCLQILDIHLFFNDKARSDGKMYTCKACCTLYQKDNIEQVRITKKQYKMSLLANTPKWLTTEMLQDIKNIYTESSRISKTSNRQMHVDHIVPLKGDNVCGLHVPWNLQIIPDSENFVKGNKYPCEY